ncbi:MAG: squalene-hopene/tetraprenyl-beta-curcumene cyclase [Mycobacteriales bacterium]
MADELIDATVASAQKYLGTRQRDDGSWCDRLASSAHATSLAVLALWKVDPARHRREIDEGLAWLADHQRADGGWSDSDLDPPSSKSGTAFTVATLYALDRERFSAAIDRGLVWLDEVGGVRLVPGMEGPPPKTWPAAAAVVWALAGLRPFEEQPYQPIEVMLLPPRLRNKISVAIPGVLGLGVMQAHVLRVGRVRRLLHRLAEPRALRWIEAAQGENGGFEESPMLTAVILIGLQVAGVADEIRERCRSYLLDTRRADGSWAIDRDLEVSATRYTVGALVECADPADGVDLDRTRDWLRDAQCSTPFTPVRIPAGGWPWALSSGWPEADDTAGALGALAALGMPADADAMRRGIHWLLTRQNRNGSWSGWVKNGSLLNDGPCPAVTAEVASALHRLQVRLPRRDPVDRAVRYVAGVQQADGSFTSLWFRHHVFGTARVLELFADLGLCAGSPARRAQGWLLGNQREDGAWPATSDEPTVEETGWALYALLRSGLPAEDPRLRRAAAWLVDAQEQGTWRASPVGLYFATLRYSDDLIAHAAALRALARWSARVTSGPSTA